MLDQSAISFGDEVLDLACAEIPPAMSVRLCELERLLVHATDGNIDHCFRIETFAREVRESFTGQASDLGIIDLLFSVNATMMEKEYRSPP